MPVCMSIKMCPLQLFFLTVLVTPCCCESDARPIVSLPACPYRVVQCVLSPRDTAVCVWTHRRGKGAEDPMLSMPGQSYNPVNFTLVWVCNILDTFFFFFFGFFIKQTSITTQLHKVCKVIVNLTLETHHLSFYQA